MARRRAQPEPEPAEESPPPEAPAAPPVPALTPPIPYRIRIIQDALLRQRAVEVWLQARQWHAQLGRWLGWLDSWEAGSADPDEALRLWRSCRDRMAILYRHQLDVWPFNELSPDELLALLPPPQGPVKPLAEVRNDLAELRQHAAFLMTMAEDGPSVMSLPAGPSAGRIEGASPPPVAEYGPVKLWGAKDQPEINGRPYRRLTPKQYEVALALVRAGRRGLSLDDLAEVNAGARNRFDVLTKLIGWRDVLGRGGRTPREKGEDLRHYHIREPEG